ncbi:MAG TPA: triple tyrosine motif-containing protein [Flavitalea sp.]|nr:triple tyrosine motif-containing protein [Flavitalea sp.]
MFCRRLLLPVLLLSAILCTAQSYIGLREIRNFQKQDYNGGSQNWNIRQDKNGIVYFANNEGLLSFDGVFWNLFPLSNKTIVRSIEIAGDNRIYIGGQDEIGYFSPDRTGKLSYVSLKHLIPAGDQQFADIWDIVAVGEDIFFRTSQKIFQYTREKIIVYRPESIWLFLGLLNNKLLAQDEKTGVLLFQDGKWVPYIDKSLLPPGAFLRKVADYGRDSSLVITNNGIVIITGQMILPFTISGLNIDSRILFSSLLKVDEEHFVLGTYSKGFYLINKKGTVVETISRKDGLQNSNVRSVFKDRNNNIWLGLDSGIDFIVFDNAIKLINPSIMNGGAGYSVLTYNDELYFAMSNGIFKLPLPSVKDFSYAPDNFKLIAEGQTWGLSVLNNMLLAGRHDGFFRVMEDKLVAVLKGTGYWTFKQIKNQQSPVIVGGNYLGLALFELNNNTIIEKGSIRNFNESARFIVIDSDNTIWISHPYRGVYKVQLTENGDANVRLYTTAKGLPSSLNNHVYKVRNKVLIATEKGVYEYNLRRDLFEPSGYFREIFGEQSVRYLKDDSSGNIWFVQEKNIGVVDFSNLKPRIIYLPELQGKILSGFEYIYPVNDNNVFVGGEKGFYHINYERYKESNRPLNVYIRRIMSGGKTDSLIFGGYGPDFSTDANQTEKTVPALSYDNSSLHIEYASPLFEQISNLEYSYYLKGFDTDWSSWSKKTEKDYTSLQPGQYVFNVKVRNNLMGESPAAVYSFVVLPPWYKTIWAWILYGLLAALMGVLLYLKHRKKLTQERQKHNEEQKRLAYLHQLEMEKSEKELMKLKNEKLETEIEYKNSELATTAMHLVQKGELLIKIKDELQHINKSGMDRSDSPEVKKLLKILNEEEKLNEEWEQFSVHFDKVHSDLLVTLKEKYQTLRAHELKLCAYLRMNLSSKEIAQLMSISVRGVEISRYRLRKKLQIPTETNLFQFLFDLQRNNLPTAPMDPGNLVKGPETIAEQQLPEN